MAFTPVSFVKKIWKDAVSGGTPITAKELNRMENGINDCALQLKNLGDSVCQKKTVWYWNEVTIDMTGKQIAICHCSTDRTTAADTFFIWNSSGSNTVTCSKLPEGMTSTVSGKNITIKSDKQKSWVVLYV